MSLDLDHFRTELEHELERFQAARKGVNHENSVAEETGDLSSGAGELADTATETYMRELDEGLEENAHNLIAEVEAALQRIERRDVRHLRRLRQAHHGGASRGSSLGDPVHRRQARAGTRMSEPAREFQQQVDVRVGSTANALQPISSAERSLAAGPAQWLALLVVAAAAIVADQLTKQLVGRTLAVGESVDLVGPFSIHHVENSGIAFGLFASRTSFVIAITAIAVGMMVWFFARSGRRHPVLPVGLGLVLGGSIANLVDRVRLGRVTDFLDLDAWPAFNLADMFIVVGVAVLFGTLVLADRSGRMHGARDGDTALQRR